MRTAIASCYNACSQGFSHLETLLCSNEMASNVVVSPEELQQARATFIDQLGRFKMWGGNAGAHQTGKASLDYRLREALHVHAQVVSLLEDLEHALEEGRC